MLRELQALSNSFQPDTVSESSKSSLPSIRPKDFEQETAASQRRKSYNLQHPSDPAYSLHVSQLYGRRTSIDSRNSETDERGSDQTEAITKVHSEHSVQRDVQREVQSDPIEEIAEQRTSSKLSKVGDSTDSTDAQQVLPGDFPPRPRHAVFQDPVAALARLSASKGSAEHKNAHQSDDTVVLRSHRHAVFGDATLVSDAQEQEASASDEDSDVQQILKDLKDNASSHAAFEDVDSLEGEDEESEEDSWEGEGEEDEESDDVDDEHSDKE